MHLQLEIYGGVGQEVDDSEELLLEGRLQPVDPIQSCDVAYIHEKLCLQWGVLCDPPEQEGPVLFRVHILSVVVPSCLDSL